MLLAIRVLRSPPGAGSMPGMIFHPWGIEDPDVVVATSPGSKAAGSGVQISHRATEPAAAAPHARNIAISGDEAPGDSPPARPEGGTAGTE
ncbi:hypothetical protein [Catenuloplanes indicus]|uniref:Uncharacterized protein n=1 Tax=Catenuloplanes indicus TaxID=137267 RepID=A0AAE3VVF6_9ACTN|nr:hypothetical protein [Catenuloplanes indicus]MDQ0363730.1 hypothetical protein [Catenuloplanes indicus]